MARRDVKIKCPFCGQVANEVRREVAGKKLFITLGCTHVIIKDALDPKDIQIKSSDGKTPFGYQVEGVQFLEDADCNGLLLDEQGLGKTIQICMLLKRNKQLLPALIVVPSGLRAQWFAELFRWTGFIAQVITSSKELPEFDYFDVFIVSIDTLRLLRPDIKNLSDIEITMHEARGRKVQKQKKPIWTDEICARFQFIVVDESHKVKNDTAARTMALRKIVMASNNGEKARVICMSGTNIEKHAAEYFVTLNLVAPTVFPNEKRFQTQHVEYSLVTGKPMGLKRPDVFKDLTKDFIIRRKRVDVLPDLPKVFRQFRLAEMEGDPLKAYIKIVKEFQEYMDKATVQVPADILGYLAKMRHITGIAKVDEAVRFVEEFLLSSDRKLVIFLHHKIAGDMLMQKIEKLCLYGDADMALGMEQNENGIYVKKPQIDGPIFAPPLYLHAELNAYTQRPQLIEEFKKPENRIMVASTLAAAEGLNLQFASDMLMMERQWNPGKEEQAEGRFPRPGSTADKINAVYLIAAGTIDDFLTQLVEEKRRNVSQTLDGVDIPWDESTLMSELTKALMTKGLKRWRL